MFRRDKGTTRSILLLTTLSKSKLSSRALRLPRFAAVPNLQGRHGPLPKWCSACSGVSTTSSTSPVQHLEASWRMAPPGFRIRAVLSIARMGVQSSPLQVGRWTTSRTPAGVKPFATHNFGQSFGVEFRIHGSGGGNNQRAIGCFHLR